MNRLKLFKLCHAKWSERCSGVSDPLWLYSLWNSPGQNTGVGSLSLLQVIFPTQRSNSGLSHCRQILYQMSHKGSPRILEWVAYPFSSESSQPRNWAGVSCITRGFLTSWAPREARFWCVSYQIVLCYFIICINLYNCHSYQDSDTF